MKSLGELATMWKVTLKGIWAKKVRFLLTGVAVDARRRVHVGHVRAHRDDLEHVRRPLHRHLPAHRRGRCGPRRSSAVSGFGNAGRGTIGADLLADDPQAPTASPPPTARCRASRSSSTRTATRSAATGQGAPTLGFSYIHDRELSTIHVVAGPRARAARTRSSSTRAAPTTPGTRSATPSRSSPRPGATTTSSPAS